MQEYISLQGANIGCGDEKSLKNPEKSEFWAKSGEFSNCIYFRLEKNKRIWYNKSVTKNRPAR
jgi:hypothetical protein